MDTLRVEQCSNSCFQKRLPKHENDNDPDLVLPAVVLSPSELSTFVTALRGAWSAMALSLPDTVSPSSPLTTSRFLAIALLKEMQIAPADASTLADRVVNRLHACLSLTLAAS